MEKDIIRLAHGGGGRLTSELVRDLFLAEFADPVPTVLGDSAILDIGSRQLSFTTDSYVVNPLFFPGGDIGSLAVYGTVNDLAMSGARPAWLSAAFIIEEGFALRSLEKIVQNMAAAARRSGVVIVTGDTKVVPRGQADGLYINTAGVGLHEAGEPLSPQRIQIGDAILINGNIGEHGAAILSARENGNTAGGLISDAAPLNGMVAELQRLNIELHALRDATRGGLGGILAELAEQSGHDFAIEEEAIPIREEVRAFSEIYGFDPLYLANEGKMVLFCPETEADRALATLRSNPYGIAARRLGRVSGCGRGRVILRNAFGASRVIGQPSGEMVPRIC